jgi:small-conductance mechanosensitive channel
MNEERIIKLWQDAWGWIVEHGSNLDILLQLVMIVATLIAAQFLRGSFSTIFTDINNRVSRYKGVARFTRSLAPIAKPSLWLLQLFIVLIAFNVLQIETILISAICSLLIAWIVINIATGLIQNTAWARLVAFCAWSIAALNIVGLLNPALAFLRGIVFSIGDTDVSLLGIVQAIVAAIIVFWIALGLSQFIDSRIHKTKALTPSVKVLFSKLTRVTLIAIAIMIVLSNSGINLTAFAVFGGALGVGIGFGLQKVISNLISGVILLMDESIKPGDVVEVGGTYGHVNAMKARYTSVITRDAKEFLIPNEDLITQQVVNWSYSSRQVRLRVPIGVSYDADIPTAIQAIIDASLEHDRVLKNPAPKCLMTGFGDSSIDLELRFWIGDPEGGSGNIKGEVLLSVWKKLKEAEIEIPFPQREVRVKMIKEEDRLSD